MSKIRVMKIEFNDDTPIQDVVRMRDAIVSEFGKDITFAVTIGEEEVGDIEVVECEDDDETM